MNYRTEATENGLEGQVEVAARNSYKTAWLAVWPPEGKHLRAVEIDNQPWQDFGAAAERSRLPIKTGPMRISVHF